MDTKCVLCLEVQLGGQVDSSYGGLEGLAGQARKMALIFLCRQRGNWILSAERETRLEKIVAV